MGLTDAKENTVTAPRIRAMLEALEADYRAKKRKLRALLAVLEEEAEAAEKLEG